MGLPYRIDVCFYVCMYMILRTEALLYIKRTRVALEPQTLSFNLLLFHSSSVELKYEGTN